MKIKRTTGLKEAQILIFVVLMAAFLILGYFQFSYLSSLNNMVLESSQVSLDVAEALLHLKGALGYTGFIHTFKNYLLRGQDSYYARTKSEYREISTSLEHLEHSAVISADAKNSIDTIRNTVNQYDNALDKIKTMHSRGQPISAIDRAVNVNDTPAAEALRVLDGWYQQTISNNETAIQSRIQFTIILFLILTTVSLLTIILLLFIILKRVLVNIHSISLITQEIANGDLSKGVTTIPRDAIGEMALNFNKAIQSLKDIIQHTQSSVFKGQNISATLADQITKTRLSTKDISARMEKIDEQITSQTSQILDASSAVEEIHRTITTIVNQISKQADFVSQASTAIEQMAASTVSVDRITTEKMKTAESLVAITKQGGEKVEKTNQIAQNAVKSIGAMQDMIDVINDIASQTDLLSMNAAIEAAHAGEAGKGFAVVADEIRKLAETTSSNAEAIAKSLTGLIERINETSSSSLESGEAFQKIEEEVQAFVIALTEISTSTNELAAGSREIQETVQALLEITTSVKTGAEEMEFGAAEINTALISIRDISKNNNSQLGESRENIENIYSSVTKISDIGEQNSSNMAELQTTVSVFTLGDSEEHAQAALSVEISQAILSHKAWIPKIQMILENKLPADELGILDANQCDLGKWINSKGGQDFGSLKPFQELQASHEEIHTLAKSILKNHKEGQRELAEQGFLVLMTFSDKIEKILKEVEAAIASSRRSAEE